MNRRDDIKHALFMALGAEAVVALLIFFIIIGLVSNGNVTPRTPPAVKERIITPPVQPPHVIERQA